MEETRAVNAASRSRWIISFVACILALTAPVQAFAATMFLSPASGTYNPGGTFSVSVYTTSADQAMNAVQGTLSFNTDILEVTGVSTTGSIISFWVQAPSFSNGSGTVQYEGVVLNPGFTGSSGKILTVTFKAKAIGTGSVGYASGAVLANDGLGTNITTGLGGGSYAVVTPAEDVPVSTTPVETPGVPSAPVINSTTHPDTSGWYANAVATLTWELPGNATDASVVIDRKPNTTTLQSRGAISSYQTDSLADGVWYAHVRIRNAAGWGSVSHYRLQIDTTKPESFTVEEVPKTDPTDPYGTFVFTASDATSGIARYEIEVGGSTADIWRDDGTHVYQSDPLDPGAHQFLFRAVDAAGNYLVATGSTTINALPPPTLYSVPFELPADQILSVSGTAFANAKVYIYIRFADTTFEDVVETTADRYGNFTAVFDRTLEPGPYSVWAIAQDARGAKTAPSEAERFVVTTSIIEELGRLSLQFLLTVIILIALIILLLILWVMARQQLAWLRRLMLAEAALAEKHQAQVIHLLKSRESMAQVKEAVEEEEDAYVDRVRRAAKSKPMPAGANSKGVKKGKSHPKS